MRHISLWDVNEHLLFQVVSGVSSTGNSLHSEPTPTRVTGNRRHLLFMVNTDPGGPLHRREVSGGRKLVNANELLTDTGVWFLLVFSFEPQIMEVVEKCSVERIQNGYKMFGLFLFGQSTLNHLALISSQN